jgi:GNAT superfamily N-acetyltransferase
MNDPEVRLLGPDDGATLTGIAAGVFDHAVSARWSTEFLADPRHHLAVALDNGVVVGMASAVHHVHPDKAPQLWVNEVAVAQAYQGRGIGRHLLERLMQLAAELECTEAWVLTDRANIAAQRLYESVGGLVPAEECIMYTIPVPVGQTGAPGSDNSSG